MPESRHHGEKHGMVHSMVSSSQFIASQDAACRVIKHPHMRRSHTQAYAEYCMWQF